MRKNIVAITIALFSAGALAEGLDLGAVQPAPEPAPVAEEGSVVADANAEPAKDCTKDDPRLRNIGAFIEALGGDEKPEPLEFTPETYASTNPRIIARLGDRYVINRPDCTTIQPIGGELTAKVPMAFHSLLSRVIRSLNDQDQLDYWMSNFEAAPISTAQALSLVQAGSWPKGVQMDIADALGVRMNRSDRHNAEYVMLLDLYLALGGSVSDNVQVIQHPLVSGNITLRTADGSAGIDVGDRVDHQRRPDYNWASSSLAAAGVTITVAEEGGRRR